MRTIGMGETSSDYLTHTVVVLWQPPERTLSIHSIHTRRRKMFCWVAVLATFVLGTAGGDLTAVSLHLRYLSSDVLFAVIFAMPANS